ncbi:MAG: TolC family protein [Phycisphaerae bacterium]
MNRSPVTFRERLVHIRVPLCMACGFAMLAIPACVSVDARPDFKQTEQRILERLEAQEVYDPTGDAAVQQKVEALLADGLTLEESVQVALLNNRYFQSLFQTIGASRADVVQSGLWTNPSLMIGTRLIEGGGRGELTFGFAQQLVDLWQIPVKKKIAEAKLEQTVLAVLNEAVRIAATTQSLYYDCLWRVRLNVIANDNLALAQQSLHLAQVRLDAGETSPLDAGLVRSQVLQAENDALLAARNLENARIALAQNLGVVRWDDGWQLADAFADDRYMVAPDEDLIATASANRFDIQIADAQVEAAAQDVDLQLMKVFPSLIVGVVGERTEQRALPDRKILADTARASIAAGRLTAPTIQSKGQRDVMRNQIIDALFGTTVQLTLPLWDQYQAQIATANFVYEQLLKEREYLFDTVTADIRQASNNARTAQKQFALFESKILPQAQENIQTAQRRYENGEESVLILIEAQDAMFVQKRQSADALRSMLVTRASLTRACGGKLPDASMSGAADSNSEMKVTATN